MTTPLHRYDRPLRPANLVERDSRFTLLVDLDGATERVFMADPGALRTVLEPDREVLVAAAENDDRKTAYDAVAVRAGDRYVPVVARLANDLFAAAVERNVLPAFEGWRIGWREPALPDGGRADFVLEPTGDGAVAGTDAGRTDGAGPTYVEVKSCTHVEASVAMFPDRQTERGRRHLRSLAELTADGTDAAVVFVVQRSDADRFAPYREVDPDFADLLAEVREGGVGVHALSTAFEPPETRLAEPALPIVL